MLIQFLEKYAGGKIIFSSFCLSMGIYSVMIFYSIPLVSGYAPEMVLFDVSPTGYTFDYAVSLLTQLGAEGRELYLSLQLPLDFVYPLSFGLSHALIICWLLNKSRIISPYASYTCLLPILGCLFDYSENIAIASMLTNFPSITEDIVQISSTLTIAKSVFVTVSYFLICVLLGVAAIVKLRSKNSNPPIPPES